MCEKKHEQFEDANFLETIMKYRRDEIVCNSKEL